MNNEQFKTLIAPLEGQITALANQPHIWRVSYVNPGKQRLSLEYVGTVVKPDTGKGDGRIHLVTGETVSVEEFEQVRRRRWPMPHEEETNPQNPTLGVQNGVMGQKGGF